MSGQAQPSSCTTPLRPASRPPRGLSGATSAASTPSARVTATSSLSALKAVSASAFGFSRPTSCVSMLPRSVGNSTRPSWVFAATRPG